MPRLHLPPERLTGDRAVLEEEAHRYLSRVLRLQPGASLTVFDGRGQEIEARVDSVSSRSTTLVLGERRTVTLTQAKITLIQAISRGERMDLVVQKTTELGVARVDPVWSERTVVQPGGEGRLRRWRTIAQEAARQCGRADVPDIGAPRPLAEALADAQQHGDRRLVLWEDATGAPLRRALAGDERAVTVLVGAEGGFTPDEVAAARAAGFQPVGLGPRILRTETAAVVAVALVQSALGGLD